MKKNFLLKYFRLNLGICNEGIKLHELLAFSFLYTIKNVIVFPVPSRDVTNQTLPGWE
jgi:hypothetical protein